MDRKQQRRADVLSRLAAGSITREQASELLQISDRHVVRILKAFKSEGIASTLHGNTGRVAENKTPDDTVKRIISMTREGSKYHGFNVCHLTDMLRDEEDIIVGRSTLDRILRENQITVSRKRRRKTHKRRERSSAEGSMLQIDGSPHDWFEGRGERVCLVGAVDDATGKIIYARFRLAEDLTGYLLMLRWIVQTYGVPGSLYHDRHTILHSPGRASIEDELAGRRPQSQFERVMDELGIRSILAHSPQAKGRVERTWGVLQDRLIKEMRLAGISAAEEGNDFLPGFTSRYNERFGVKPRDKESAWIQVDSRIDMDYYFCVREDRCVRNDHTISFRGQILQILPEGCGGSLSGRRVNVHVNPEGSVRIYDDKRRLKHRVIEARVQNTATCATGVSEESHKRVADPSGEARRRGWLYADLVKVA